MALFGSRRSPVPNDPLAVDYTRRPSERVERYGLLLRLSDRTAGRRDGKLGLPGIEHVQDGSDPQLTTQWLERNRHTYEESDRKEYLDCRAVCAVFLRDLDDSMTSLPVARHRHDVATAKLLEVRNGPSEAELNRRGPAELDDSEATVQQRRRRKYQVTVNAAEQAATSARSAVENLEATITKLRATIVVVYESAQSRSLRRREFHERRAMTYRRSLVRKHRERVTVDRHLPKTAVERPAWTTAPCPWLTSSTPEQVL
jgi:hypothetical protein